MLTNEITVKPEPTRAHRHECFAFRALPRPHCDCLKILACRNCRFYISKDNARNNAEIAAWKESRSELSPYYR